MSYRWLKLIFVLTAAFLVWMAASAFRNPSAAAVDDPAEEIPSPAVATANDSNPTPDHSQHLKTLPPTPRRLVDPSVPLAADSQRRMILDWDVLAATSAGGKFPPRYPSNLTQADGKEVVLTGYMCPLDEAGDMGTFLLLEIPVGCFYCLAPAPTSLVLVELAGGRREPLHYDLMKVVGRLQLNRDNPEDFLYAIDDARISPAD